MSYDFTGQRKCTLQWQQTRSLGVSVVVMLSETTWKETIVKLMKLMKDLRNTEITFYRG